TGRVVADGEDKIDRRSARRGELIPTLATKVLSRQIRSLEEIHGHGMHLSLGMASRTEGPELAVAQGVEKRLGEDAARRVACAQEKDVVGANGGHFAQQFAAGSGF